jgi:hypothetical protein
MPDLSTRAHLHRSDSKGSHTSHPPNVVLFDAIAITRTAPQSWPKSVISLCFLRLSSPFTGVGLGG